jgi:cell division septation protein DedD
VARGIRKALGLPLDGSEAASSAAPADRIPAASAGGSLYTVQVGAFAYIENARQRLIEAQAAGFSDAYIYQKQI